MRMADRIEAALREALAPAELEVVDESAQHAGHAGAPAGGESHFRVNIAAEALGPMSRIERHRTIHAALGDEIIGAIHALAIEARGT